MPSQRVRLYAAAFFMEIWYGLFLLAGSMVAYKAIGRPLLIGLTGTLHVAMRIAGNLVFGRLSDRVGRKHLMVFSCGLSFLALYLLNFSGAFFIFLAYFVSGVGNSIFWPLIEAWIGRSSADKSLMGSLGAFGVVFTTGIAVGNLLASLVIGKTLLPPTLIGCAFCVLVGFIVAGTEDRAAVEKAPAPTGADIPDAAAAMTDPRRKRRFMFIGWIANFGTWTTIGIHRFLFPKLCMELGLTARSIGLINAVLYLAWAVMFLALLKHGKWAYRLRPLLIFQSLGIAAALLLWRWPSVPVFIAAFCLFGACAGMTYFSSMFYGQDGARDKGHKSGLHEMIISAGMLISPFVGGALAEQFTLRTPFLFAAAVIVAAIGVEILLFRKRVLSVEC